MAIPLILQTAYGTISYVEPDVPRVLRMIGRSGIDLKTLTASDGSEKLELIGTERSMLEMAGLLMENLDMFVVAVDLKIGDVHITTYEQAKKHFELMGVLNQLVAEFMRPLQMLADKKK